MSTTTCQNCGGLFHWNWEDAFDKFGFDDGDGQVMTDTVIETLTNAGYDASAEPWGFHNVVITSIKRDGIELIRPDVDLGYADPRSYLPDDIVSLLDEKLDDNAEVEP